MTRRPAEMLLGGQGFEQRDPPSRPPIRDETSPKPGQVSLLSLGEPMPTRRANPPIRSGLSQQTEPSTASELMRLRTAYLQQNTTDFDLKRRNAQALTLLDEWAHEPDDLGEEWWSNFEKELESQRNRSFERE